MKKVLTWKSEESDSEEKSVISEDNTVYVKTLYMFKYDNTVYVCLYMLKAENKLRNQDR